VTGASAPASRLAAVSRWKPAYLVHGDDHGRIAQRRANLRTKAEAESGMGGVEVLEGDGAAPEAVAAALTAMTFAMGRRFVIVDGCERWKEAEVETVAAALSGMDPASTTVAFFAREEGRARTPDALREAVEAAGGVVGAERAVKPWELPRWAAKQAAALGLELDPGAARALVAQVGERQQRLLRELEKLALWAEPQDGATVRLSAEDVEAAAAASADRKVWGLGDAIVAGRRADALLTLLELRAQGERLPGLIFSVARRLRDAVSVAEALAAGRPAAEVRRGLRMPHKAAERFVADVQRRDAQALREALALMADLELESRGGGATPLGEDAAAARYVLATTT
jgi:DNA polymerase III subunit delta